ncbi:MAG: aspartate aminotransferase family protein, partial [Myxococcales bacterium]|nr:aspartate aminotransferase family protein [Myxococcales bacterium]
APEGFTKVFFTLGGSEATENALKIARMVTGRHKLVSRYRSYHGATMGALSLSGDWRRPPLEPGIAGVVHAMDCYCDRCPFGKTLDTCQRECAQHIGQVLDLEGPGTVAAVFLEPVPGANGVLVPPEEYWPMVREACDRHGTMLVADEVLTGFGRTGRWFGFQHFDVTPDLITVGKGLTAGYGALGAVLVHERLASHFDEHTLYGGLTNYAHPLGVAAALEAIAVYEEEGLIERAAAMAPALRDGLAAIAAKHPGRVRCTRSIGLLAALEIEADADAWGRLGAALERRRVYMFLKGRTRMVVMAPPLCVTAEELEAGLGALDEAIAEMDPA